ncbi:hypothetical protein ACQJBY_071899 [Aegilops geniculata]
MERILAFLILSLSPAEIAGAGFGTPMRLSWRGRSGEQTEKGMKKQQQQEKVDQGSLLEKKREVRFAPEFFFFFFCGEFAPEFDGVNCFESIISF